MQPLPTKYPLPVTCRFFTPRSASLLPAKGRAVSRIFCAYSTFSSVGFTCQNSPLKLIVISLMPAPPL